MLPYSILVTVIEWNGDLGSLCYIFYGDDQKVNPIFVDDVFNLGIGVTYPPDVSSFVSAHSSIDEKLQTIKSLVITTKGIRLLASGAEETLVVFELY